MSDPRKLVTRASIEEFSSGLINSGALSIDGRSKDWLDKVFRSSTSTFISHHAWRNYLAIFVYENQEKFITNNFSEIDIKADRWFSTQPSASQENMGAP